MLYVLTNTFRYRENPALDVAVAIGNKLKKPVWIHGFIDDREIKTKRRAAFILDGFREFQSKCLSHSIRCTFSMSYNKNRKPHHLSLTHRACVVVTDEAFVKPHLNTMNSISKASPCLTIAVDTSCILPAQHVNKSSISRAYKFRAATSEQRKKRALIPYSNAPLPQHKFETLCLEPFLDLSKFHNTQLLTRLEELSDVSVIRHTVGGEYVSFLRRDSKEADDKSHSYTSNRTDQTQNCAGKSFSATAE